MIDDLNRFQAFVRKANQFSTPSRSHINETLHPFDERNIHPDISWVSQKLFDNGHYSHATFEAFKFIDKEVSRISTVGQTGFKLMMQVFNEVDPKIQLTDLTTASKIDEQKGFSFLFAGSMMGIRNPRGHEVGNMDTIEQCLDHLCLASLLLRKISSRVFP